MSRRADAERAVKMANSYTRMGAVLKLKKHISDMEWLLVLGALWSICDNIDEHRAVLGRHLKRAIDAGRHSLMMTPSERKQLEALPQTLTVYRGCYENNVDGLSWTLDRDVAESFPTLNRYRQDGQALLITGTVARDQAVFKNDREEQEIISPFVTAVAREELEAA